MRIAIVGSHCAGKTTLFESLKSEYPEFRFIEEYIQILHEMNIPFNEDCNNMTQYIASDICIDSLNCDNTISDRCLLDVLVYSDYLLSKKVISQNCYDEICDRWLKYRKKIDILFFVRPLKRQIENNGIRSTDYKFQEQIDQTFVKFLYNENNWMFSNSVVCELPENHEERMKKVKETIDVFKSRS